MSCPSHRSSRATCHALDAMRRDIRKEKPKAHKPKKGALCCCRDLTQTLQSAAEWAKQPIQFRHLPHSVEVLPWQLSEHNAVLESSAVGNGGCKNGTSERQAYTRVQGSGCPDSSVYTMQPIQSRHLHYSVEVLPSKGLRFGVQGSDCPDSSVYMIQPIHFRHLPHSVEVMLPLPLLPNVCMCCTSTSPACWLLCHRSKAAGSDVLL